MVLNDNEEKDDNNIIINNNNNSDSNNNNNIHPSLSLSSNAVARNPHKRFKFIQKFITNLFPILSWFPLSIHRLPSDIIAGIYLGLYQIPQCIAYSLIVQYPMVHLLHTNIISSIMYTIIGHHRRLSNGVFALISAIYFRIILNRLGHDDVTTESVAISITLLIGIFTMVAGLLRLGSLVRFIPNETLAGYRSGVYILVITLLLRSMGGKRPWMNLGDGRPIMLIPELYRNQLIPCIFPNINWNSWGVSMGCLAIMGFFRGIHHYWDNLFRGRYSYLRQIIRRIPVESILITLSMIVVHYLPTITDQYKIYLIDSVIFKTNDTTLLDNYQPNFHFQWPSFGKYFLKIWSECINATILLLCYTHSLSIDYNIMDTERIRRHNPRKRKRQLNPKRMKFFRMGWHSYNPNNEMLVSGFINFCISFLQCLPCGPSRIRSNRLRNVGSCTQISGLIASLVTLLIWMTVPKNYLSQIPICVVSSIVTFETCMALLFEIQQLKYYWKVSIVDAIVWLLTISSFLLLNIELSLYCSIGLSLLVYCFRTKNFKLFQFQPEKALITLNDSVVLVPESSPDSENNVVSREGNDSDDYGGDDDTTSNIFKMIPQSTLKSIQIYKVDQQLLTISNMDAFVLDVCRKVSKTIKRFKNDQSNPSNIINRLIFDCRSFCYMDWPSIRLVKATVMRMIQVAESWNPTIQSPFVITSDNDNNQNQLEQKLKQYLIVVFVFPTQFIRMIHNAGKFNIHFYHSLHQCLHLTLKGAINMIISFPNNNNNNLNNDHFDTIVSEQEIIINKIQSVPASPTIQSIRSVDIPKIPNQIPLKPLKQSKQSKLAKKFISLDRKRRKRSLDPEDSSKNDSEQNSNTNDISVLPISFRKQNLDHEFDLSPLSLPSTSKSYPRLEIIEELSLKNQFNISASTSSIRKKDASSQTKPLKPSRSDGIVSRQLRSPPPPPPPLQLESRESMVSFQTATSDLDQNDSADDIATNSSTRMSAIKERLEILLGGGKVSKTFHGINEANNDHVVEQQSSSTKMEESEF